MWDYFPGLGTLNKGFVSFIASVKIASVRAPAAEKKLAVTLTLWGLLGSEGFPYSKRIVYATVPPVVLTKSSIFFSRSNQSTNMVRSPSFLFMFADWGNKFQVAAAPAGPPNREAGNRNNTI